MDYSYNIEYVGSCLVNCAATTAFITCGSASGDSMGANIRNMTVDGMNQGGNTLSVTGRACHFQNATFLRAYGAIAKLGPSSVMSECTIAGSLHNTALSITGTASDNRVTNNYIYGSGDSLPIVKIEKSDCLFAQNHIWKDSSNLYIGDGVLISFAGGTNVEGNVSIDTNQFDTSMGANIRIRITGNTTVRCINILGNESLQIITAQNYQTAVVAAAAVTIANGSPTLVIGAISSGVVAGANGTTTSASAGTIYLGGVITGTNIPANTRIISQESGVPGGAGSYTMSANATGTASGTYNVAGFPYIALDIAAGSTLRMLNVVGNIGLGGSADATKSPYANFIDGTGIAGSLLCLNVQGNLIDNCGLGLGSSGTVGSFLTPTSNSGNHHFVNSASTTPVAF